MTGETAALFARSVARAVSDHSVTDPWWPGAWADDADASNAHALEAALGEIGWSSLVEEDGAPEIVAVAAVELGRGLVSLSSIDQLLGGSPVVSGLVRHGRPGAPAFELLPDDGLRELEVEAINPVSYGDASGVAALVEVRLVGPVDTGIAARRLEAWRAASIGYLAGLARVAFEDCLEHVKSREAFGATLAARETVQARLADAATALEGARLLVGEEHSWPALSHVARVAVDVTAACHQLTGALGYALEYPLQRRSRRARAIRSWAEWAADATTSSRGRDGK
jgi:hypothetical protein